jgi:hypothetical protein
MDALKTHTPANLYASRDEAMQVIADLKTGKLQLG